MAARASHGARTELPPPRGRGKGTCDRCKHEYAGIRWWHLVSRGRRDDLRGWRTTSFHLRHRHGGLFHEWVVFRTGPILGPLSWADSEGRREESHRRLSPPRPRSHLLPRIHPLHHGAWARKFRDCRLLQHGLLVSEGAAPALRSVAAGIAPNPTARDRAEPGPGSGIRRGSN